MKVEFWVTGKTAFPYLDEGIAIYEKRLRNYLNLQIVVFQDIKNAKSLTADLLKQKECEQQLAKLLKDDFVVLLDERGKQWTSIEFAGFMEQKMQLSVKRIIFVVGGAFGFSDAMYERANLQVSLSKMTFSHQMIRLFFVEQLYRAMTITRGEPYHNE